MLANNYKNKTKILPFSSLSSAHESSSPVHKLSAKEVTKLDHTKQLIYNK
jgi:hypothetical protein